MKCPSCQQEMPSVAATPEHRLVAVRRLSRYVATQEEVDRLLRDELEKMGPDAKWSVHVNADLREEPRSLLGPVVHVVHGYHVTLDEHVEAPS